MNEEEMICAKCRDKVTDNATHLFNCSKNKWEFYCHSCFKIGVPMKGDKKVVEDQIKLEVKDGLH